MWEPQEDEETSKKEAVEVLEPHVLHLGEVENSWEQESWDEAPEPCLAGRGKGMVKAPHPPMGESAEKTAAHQAPL